jgi:CRP-like cAMP-binding protein
MGLNDGFTLTLLVCSLLVALAFFVGHDPSLRELKAAAPSELAGTFPHLPRRALVEVASRTQPLSFQMGQTILRQGDPADRFYIVTTGEVNVTRQTDAGAVVALATLGRGQFFGEIGLLANLPRTATVTAATPTEKLAIDGAAFRDMVAQSAETAQDLQTTMGERLALLR